MRDLCGVIAIPRHHKIWSLRLRDYVSRGSLLLVVAAVAGFAQSSPSFAIVEKEFIAPILMAPANGEVADVDAARISYDPITHIAVATGMVRMTYGPYVLVASRVEYNQLTGNFKANGSVELREPNGNVLQADVLAITEKFKAGFASHVRALLTNDVTITAEYAQHTSDGITVYENATYTACKNCEDENGNHLWVIETDQTTHDTNSHNLYHVNPRLKIRGVTVAALPYWQQPDPSVKRRTGFLAPQFKKGDAYGYGVATPYFWALAPNYDLTITPMVNSEQGLAGDVEWRHRVETGSYNVHVYGAYQSSPPVGGETWRGAVRSEGKFAIGQNWNWGWDGTAVTDRTFLSDYDYDNRDIAQNQLYATGVWDQTYVDARALSFNALDAGVNADTLPTALPFVTGEKIINDIALGGDLKFNWNIYAIERNQADTTFDHGTSQTRGTAEVEWKTQLIGDIGTVITPFAKLRSDIYVTNNVPDTSVPGGFRDSETTTRVLPSVGVDARYPFIANFASGQSIISPVFQIISAADESDANKIGNEDAITLNFDSSSLFLSDRFTGLDRYEAGTRANIGLSYAFIGNGGNYVRASIGESVHLAGENSFGAGSGLEGTQSDLVGAVAVQPWEGLTLSYQARIEEDFSQINRQEATASLTFDSFSADVSYLNFGAEPNYGRSVAEQWVSANARQQISAGWYVFGGLGYDFENDVLTRKTAGLEFDCDCMNFKLSYTGTEDALTHATEDRVMMSIEFATLGKTGFSSKF